MLFNSYAFLVFFPIVAILYFVIPNNKWRNYFLLAASYYFYMGWKAEYALLLLSSTLITYLSALAIQHFSYKKIALLLCILLNLSILFFFKYYQFAAENIAVILDWLHLSIRFPKLDILLPVGISFYIFQALGYSIDVYRGDIKAERNFFKYALFVSFFPQLVAGPIERSKNLLRQFEKKHTFNGDLAVVGITMMLWGYFLKLVIADNIAEYVDLIYNHGIATETGTSMLLASILFCFQLYGDFAGYSYIAIGCSKVMGFHLMDNFRRPYFMSTSIQDYWKRNHISLTSWFMDYVYYPLVGNSIRLSWWCFSIFITFVISGFWHGAAWTYVVCFAIFGIYLVVCSLKEKAQSRFEKQHQLKKKEWWKWLNRFITFLLVAFALIFFRANSLADAITVIEKIFTNITIQWTHPNGFRNILFCLLVLFITESLIEYKKISVTAKNFPYIYTSCSIVLLFFILWFGKYNGGQFIYFQF